jgi:hypothetical protein
LSTEDGQTDGHGETSIPPLQLRCGGYNKYQFHRLRF